MSRKYVSSEDFIKAVLVADTLDDVAETTGLKRVTCYQRLSKYIKMGVNLPTLKSKRNGVRFDVVAANELVTSLQK